MPAPTPETPDVPRSLVYLMLVQFAVGGALYPFLTLYLIDAELSLPQINTVLFAASAAATLMPFLWGWVADRVLALNRLIPLLHLLSAFVLLAMTRSVTYPAIVLALFLFGGLQQPTNALANALCYHNLKDPAHQFGRLRLWGSIGWMLPSLPIFLWHALSGSTDLQFAIYLTAGLQFLLVVGSPLLPHTPPPGKRVEVVVPAAEPITASPPRGFSKDLKQLVTTPGFVVLLAVAFLMLSSFSIMFYHSGPQLERAGFSRKWIGPVLSLGVVFEIPLFLTLRGAISRYGYRATLAIGGAAALVRHLVFAFSSSPLALIAASTLIAPSVVFYLIAASLVANSLAPREVKATAQSLFTLVGSGLGTMHGLWVTRSLTRGSDGDLQSSFLFAAGCAAAALLLMPWIRLKRG